jgi:hypothetical protein
MSIANHKMQADRGIDRLQAIQELETELKELQSQYRGHRQAADAAQATYKAAISTAHSDNTDLCHIIDAVLQLGATKDVAAIMSSAAVDDFVGVAKDFFQHLH